MAFIKKLYIVDWLFIVYLLYCMLWIVIFHDEIVAYNQENPLYLYGQYLMILAIIILIILLYHYTRIPLLKLARYWYPAVLFAFLYTNTTKMDLGIFHEYLDPIMQGYDQLIFGYQPATIWGLNNNTFFWQEFFHYAYFSYYLMFIGIPLYIYIKYDIKEFIHAVTNLMFVFFACLVIYMILPVVGGRFDVNLTKLTIEYRHGLFTHIMAFIYQRNDHWGAAFPSSHVAIALTLFLVSYKYIKGFALIILIHVILLAISTVFCHYHYAVDVIVGLIYGFIMYGISEIVFAFTRTAREMGSE